jgi:tetratricopeptide (TPR) repeat protein
VTGASSARINVRLLLPLMSLLTISSCAYFNTFYNARESYQDALELAEENPDTPTSTEAVLLEEAVTGAAKVLAGYPDSRWADDAQLLMGDALLLSGQRTLTGTGTSDFNEAMRAYAAAAVMTEDAVLRDRAYIGMGRAAMSLDRYNDASASFESVSETDGKLYASSRIHLMDALLQGGEPEAALAVSADLEIPGNDSLTAELQLMEARALMETGRPDSAAVLALAAGESFGRGSGYCRALTVAAEAWITAGRPEEAVGVLSSLLLGYRSNMEMAEIALLQGKAMELAGDLSGAVSSYGSSADRDTYREFGAEALYLRAIILERQERIADALLDLQELSVRSGGYVWIRLAAGRLHDLELLSEYADRLAEAQEEDTWLLRLMAAEKRMDLYGDSDSAAVEELRFLASEGPDMEKAMALASLAGIVPPDSAGILMTAALELSRGGDLATVLEDSLGMPHGADYESRPSVVLERAWDLISGGDSGEAHELLVAVLADRWSEGIRPGLLWAAYVAAENARLEDSLMELYLTELSEEYPGTLYGRTAAERLGLTEGSGGEDE